MLNLAVFIDSDVDNVATVETFQGKQFKAPDWPTDSDPKMIAFLPSSKSCEVVDCDELAADIGCALTALEATGLPDRGKPKWFQRLALYAAGTNS